MRYVFKMMVLATFVVSASLTVGCSETAEPVNTEAAAPAETSSSVSFLICVSINGNAANWSARDQAGNTSETISMEGTWRRLDVSNLSEPFTVHNGSAKIDDVMLYDIIVADGSPAKLQKVKWDDWDSGRALTW